MDAKGLNKGGLKEKHKLKESLHNHLLITEERVSKEQLVKININSKGAKDQVLRM